MNSLSTLFKDYTKRVIGKISVALCILQIFLIIELIVMLAIMSGLNEEGVDLNYAVKIFVTTWTLVFCPILAGFVCFTVPSILLLVRDRLDAAKAKKKPKEAMKKGAR